MNEIRDETSVISSFSGKGGRRSGRRAGRRAGPRPEGGGFPISKTW